MLEGIEELKNKLAEVTRNADILETIKTFTGLDIAISNAKLLSDALISFYKEEKSAYFPRTITVTVETYIKDANAQLNTLLAKKPAPGKQLQENLDKLYAICLQSGIISFGFNTKELIKVLDDAKSDVQGLADKVIKVNNDIELQTKAFKKNVDEKNALLDSNINDSNKLKENITQIEQVITENRKNIEKSLEASKQILEEIKKIKDEGSLSKTAVDSEVKNAKNIISQLQTVLENANQSASQITAKSATASETLSAIKERKKTADEFYTTVENYKKEMLTATKEGKANYAELKGSCDVKIKEYTAKTDEIMQQNAAYQEEIKELLAKAVSGGLFKVFNQRQVFLSKGTRFWKWAVVASSILVAGVTFPPKSVPVVIRVPAC